MQRLATLVRGEEPFALAELFESLHHRVSVDALDDLFLPLAALVRLEQIGEPELQGGDTSLENVVLVMNVAFARQARVQHAEALVLQVPALKGEKLVGGDSNAMLHAGYVT